MKTNLRIDGTMILTGAAIVAAIGVTYLVKKKGAAVVEGTKKVVTEGLNPASTENYAYRGVNAMGEYVTGDSDWNLGSKIYESVHKSDGSVSMGGAFNVASFIANPFANVVGNKVVDYYQNAPKNEVNGVPVNYYNAYASQNTLPQVSTRNWWDGTNYDLEDWEKENPFAEPPPPETKYSNWVSDGVNWVGEKASGEKEWTLGGWLYEVTH